MYVHRVDDHNPIQAQQADVGSPAMSTDLVHDVTFPSNNEALERLILVLARLVPGSSQF